ncbi:hypothetical protein L596_020239 [Steinernema carpocapsae]|uniref:Uncharacterized protein n=1 Tax=Steinernema carpocapsae TaxID=34508 RepID=A0A4U5MSX7_STECR|nr:hypothetical protein L596_020239 [Steinernema carpocapsae]
MHDSLIRPMLVLLSPIPLTTVSLASLLHGDDRFRNVHGFLRNMAFKAKIFEGDSYAVNVKGFVAAEGFSGRAVEAKSGADISSVGSLDVLHCVGVHAD